MRRKFIGLELLRHVSMLMIILFHIVVYNDLDTNIMLISLTALGGLGVNTFAIITGFVAYTEKEKPFKPQRYLRTWLTVFIYSVGITLIAKKIALQQVDTKTLVMSVLPVTSSWWWYFSSWTAVFFLQPFLLTLARNLSVKKQNVIIYIIVFCLYTTAAGLLKDPFNLGWGYSTLWLCMLYMVGTMLRKHAVATKMTVKSLVLLLSGGMLFSLISIPAVAFLSKTFVGSYMGAKLLTDYTSPLLVFLAMLMVLLFAKIRINGRLNSLVAFLGPASFGIYIIHAHPVIKERLCEMLGWIQTSGTVEKIAGAFVVTVIIWFVCLLIECVRLLIFKGVEQLFIRNRKGKNLHEPI